MLKKIAKKRRASSRLRRMRVKFLRARNPFHIADSTFAVMGDDEVSHLVNMIKENS
jgi:hypothetical protein